jgi:hypothetical protein
VADFNGSRTDADVALPLRRMIHLVSLPSDVFGNKTVLAALSALLAARPELIAQAAGPTRHEFASATAGLSGWRGLRWILDQSGDTFDVMGHRERVERA